MKETCSFSLWKHRTPHPHHDLLVLDNGKLRHWIVPSGITNQLRGKRLAVEEKTACVYPAHALEHGIEEDSYGRGRAELGDRGDCEIETSKKIKLVIKADGGKMSGRYLLIVPGWGRWTGKRLWVIERIKDAPVSAGPAGNPSDPRNAPCAKAGSVVKP